MQDKVLRRLQKGGGRTSEYLDFAFELTYVLRVE